MYQQIRDQSFEAAPGKFGENSDEVFEIALKHAGRFNEPEEYENIVIKSEQDGLQLHLRDVARIEFGASNYTSQNRLDGRPSVTIDVVQQSGANAVEIDKSVRAILAEQVFPEGINYEITYSVRDQIDESMSHVKTTLLEAFLLVFLVVFIFLQDIRATFITAITIPISLTGTFFFLSLIGVSMNVLSMFSIVLSIGIVVDNAIVVVEAVFEKMQNQGMSARQAVTEALAEITSAIISITIVMAAVFLPVAFLQGPVGVFYQEFAYTIIISIVISAVIALTLAPMLFVLLYKNEEEVSVVEEEEEGVLDKLQQSRKVRITKVVGKKGLRKFDTLFDKFTRQYVKLARRAIQYPWISVAGLLAVVLITVFLAQRTPSAFIPTEDDNFLIFTLKMPEGASLHRTNVALVQADSILQQEPAVASVNTVSGYDVVSGSESPSSGLAYVLLNDIGDRGDTEDINDLIKHLMGKLTVISDAKGMNMYPRPTVQGFGDFDGVQIMLQDRSDGDLSEFGVLVSEFIAELSQQKEIDNAFTSYNTNFPQYKLNIDYKKAKALGVNVKDMMFTVQSNFGQTRVGDFNRFTRQYGVFMQSDISYRENPEAFNAIFVKNDQGEMVPVNTIVQLEETFGPETVTRYNLYTAARINITPAAGYSTGDVMNRIENPK